WAEALPDDTYCVTIGVVAAAGLLGRIDTSVKPGSVTAGGCVVLVSATVGVPAGGAGLHVTAAP
ncbi:MAG: hypothetical protein ACRDSN_13680, partial [Pseudonocardiaceae bacterium]